jgi:RNA polymerase sigma factor (sigma-70 family)
MVAMVGRGKDIGAAATPAPLAAELQSSSPPGFDALFDAYFDRAVRLAWLLAPGQPSAAEDVAADAIARVWPKWAKGRVDDFWPYLRVAIVNQVKARGRRFGLVARYSVELRGGEHEAAVVDRAVLTSALLALPPRQRTAVVLRYYEDLPEADAARAMGCSVGTVKSTTARGLSSLRAQLERMSHDD